MLSAVRTCCLQKERLFHLKYVAMPYWNQSVTRFTYRCLAIYVLSRTLALAIYVVSCIPRTYALAIYVLSSYALAICTLTIYG